MQAPRLTAIPKHTMATDFGRQQHTCLVSNSAECCKDLEQVLSSKQRHQKKGWQTQGRGRECIRMLLWEAVPLQSPVLPQTTSRASQHPASAILHGRQHTQLLQDMQYFLIFSCDFFFSLFAGIPGDDMTKSIYFKEQGLAAGGEQQNLRCSITIAAMCQPICQSFPQQDITLDSQL